jgi:hypothetical protein
VKNLTLGIALLLARVAWAGPGQLVITTNPPGATVAVDGQNLGLSPVTARNLLPGDHMVQVWFTDGKYQTRVEKVAADSSSVVSFDEAAPAPTPPPTPKPARGNLAITTVPSGANVAVDGQLVGVSPITARDLAPGDHLVQVTWADGQSGQQTVSIAGDAKVELRNPLAPPAPEPSAAPAPTATPPSYEAAAMAHVTAQPEKKPVWKKWWFWTAIGGAAVVVVAVGLGVGLGTASSGGTRYGTLEF